MSVLPKIQALIARAAHPETPVEEARTSAVIAAKLILEHEVVLTEKGGQRLPIFSEQSYPRPYNPFDFIEVIFDEIRRGGLLYVRHRSPLPLGLRTLWEWTSTS